MDDFVFGMVVGEGQAKSARRAWENYAERLEGQVGKLQQALQNEQIRRATNRADIAALKAVIRSLPADVQPLVQSAISTHYAEAFIKRAMELGVNQQYAAEAAVAHVNGNRRELSK